jgi:hypothetical protein
VEEQYVTERVPLPKQLLIAPQNPKTPSLMKRIYIYIGQNNYLMTDIYLVLSLNGINKIKSLN